MSTLVVPGRLAFVSSINLSIAQRFAESNSGCSARTPALRHLVQIVIQRTLVIMCATKIECLLECVLGGACGSVFGFDFAHGLIAAFLHLHAKQIVINFVHIFVFLCVVKSVQKSAYAVKNV